MLFKRVQYTAGGQEIPGKSSVGTGLIGNVSITSKTTDANHTITVAEMAGGVIYYSALSAGRNVTTPTAALILAAAQDMDIGDTFLLIVSIQDAFAITWVAGTNVTLLGRATTPASSNSIIVVEKTSATTVNWTVL
jgi:hypothetical protein